MTDEERKARLEVLRENHAHVTPHYAEKDSANCWCGECTAHFLLGELERMEGERLFFSAKANENGVKADAAQARVKELEGALERLDAHIDFATPIEPGDWGVEDPSGLNEAFADAHGLLAPRSERAALAGGGA